MGHKKFQNHLLINALWKTSPNPTLQPCTGIYLLSASGSKIVPVQPVILDLYFGKLKHLSIAFQNLSRSLFLGLDFHHRFRIGTDWDEKRKKF